VVFTVSLNSASGKTVAVDYATVDGSALAGQDYGATQGTLTFAPGVTSQTFTVNIIGDNLKEGNQSFTVQLSNPVNATIGDASGTGTITDDDTPAFWIYNANIVEGDSATSTLNFIVQLLKPSTQAVTVRYNTSPGSAEAGSDYIHTSGTLSFAAGETLQVVSVQIIGDAVDENDETFTVTLSNPSAGTQIGRGAATGTIYDVLGSPFHNLYLPLIVR
jgi:chitinase